MALNFILQNNFKPNVGMRAGSRKIGVLVTDGKSQDEIVFNSQMLRDAGIELYAIGEWSCRPEVCEVTVVFRSQELRGDVFLKRLFVLSGVKNADENELRSIATDPDDIHMFNVNDFKFLTDIVDDLTNNLCNSVKGSGGNRAFAQRIQHMLTTFYFEHFLELIELILEL